MRGGASASRGAEAVGSATMPSDGRARGDWLGAWLFAGFLALYTATSERHVLGGDNPEFATLFAVGGVAHPSGYPLYTLYLRALAWLPAASPAHGAAWATALLGALAVAVTYRACLAWCSDAHAAALGAVLLGTGDLCWDASTRAEVFAMNALFAAGIVWVAAPDGPLRGSRRATALGALAGTGLGAHLTLVLLAPLGGWALALALRESRHRTRALGLTLLAAALGLTSYLSLPWAAAHHSAGWVWGDFPSLGSVWDHLRRKDFGSLQLGLYRASREPLRHCASLGSELLVELQLWPFAAGLVFALRSAWGALRQRPRGLREYAEPSLVLSACAAGPVFVSLLNLSPEGLGGSVVRRFYLLPVLLCSVLAARGVSEAWRLWPIRPGLRLAVVVVSLGLGLVVASARDDDRGVTQVESYLRDSLALVPARAVILGGGDLDTFGFAYAQRALGLRPDVVFIAPRMLHYPWYHRRASAAFGAALVAPRAGSLSVPALVRQVQASGRPLFMTDELVPGLARSFAVFPVGPLLAVPAPGSLPPPPAELERVNRRALEGFALQPPRQVPPGTWLELVMLHYARPWQVLAGAYERAGAAEQAARSRAVAAQLLGSGG